MKNNLTFRECFELKEKLLDTLETLEEFITFKEILENADHISESDYLAFRSKSIDLANALFRIDCYDYIYKEAGED